MNTKDDMLHKGDIIECHDADDLIEVMTDLLRVGIETDIMYEKDEKRGYWLVVTKVE